MLLFTLLLLLRVGENEIVTLEVPLALDVEITDAEPTGVVVGTALGVALSESVGVALLVDALGVAVLESVGVELLVDALGVAVLESAGVALPVKLEDEPSDAVTLYVGEAVPVRLLGGDIVPVTLPESVAVAVGVPVLGAV